MFDKKRLNKKANVFIYILILINIALVMGVIVFNNSQVLSNNLSFGVNTKAAFSKIYDKAVISLDSIRKYNINGNGFLDGISCPTKVTMSGTFSTGSLVETGIMTQMYYTAGSRYCLGDFNGDTFRIYYNVDDSNFDKAYYLGDVVDLDYTLGYTGGLYNVAESSFGSTVNGTTNDLGFGLGVLVDGIKNEYKYLSDSSELNPFIEVTFDVERDLFMIVLEKKNNMSGEFNNGRILGYDQFGSQVFESTIVDQNHKKKVLINLKFLTAEQKVKTIRLESTDGKMLGIGEFTIKEKIANGKDEWIGNPTFNDPELTQIWFDVRGVGGTDNFDDDFNSDNYRVTSFSGVYYPGGYQDDDVIPRKTIFGNINPGTIYENVFWTNTKTSDFIEKNPNNDDILNLKAGDVDNAYIHMDLFNEDQYIYDIKILEFDKSIYNTDFSLYPINSSNGKDLNNNVGYIQNNSGVLSLSKNITGNEYVFDFKNKDYGIFMTNNSEGNLVYRLTSETNTGTGIYINPIDDSFSGTIEILSNNIIIGGDKNFIGEHFIYTDLK